MGRDRVRLESYQVALQQVSSGKTVVDVGAGNGVLSFYSYEAGALKVYAIEKSGIASQLKKNIGLRKLKGSVKLMNCLAEEAPLEQI